MAPSIKTKADFNKFTEEIRQLDLRIQALEKMVYESNKSDRIGAQQAKDDIFEAMLGVQHD